MPGGVTTPTTPPIVVMQDTRLELNVLERRLPLDPHYATEFVPVKV
jgi:hypothetical protein